MSSSFSEFTQPGKKPVVNSIFDFSAEALGEIRLWLEQNPPAVPITSVLGFSQFTSNLAIVETEQSTTSTSFVDLGTVGPEVTGLSDGRYIALWGASCFTSSASFQGLIALNTNGTTDAGVFTEFQGASPVSVARGTTLVLSAGSNNTVKAVYASGDATNTASFRHRWLILLRYANK